MWSFFFDNVPQRDVGAVGGGSSGSSTACGRFFSALGRQLHAMSYLCPGLLPWVDSGPATEISGKLKIFMYYVDLNMFSVLLNLITKNVDRNK